MNYDVQLRYAPQIRGNWEDVRISVIRPDGIGHDSACFNINPLEEQERQLRLNEYESRTIALPELCLEEGKTYKFIVSFHRQSAYEPNPKAQILVDSVSRALRFAVPHLKIFSSSSHWFRALKWHQSSTDPRPPLFVWRISFVIAVTRATMKCLPKTPTDVAWSFSNKPAVWSSMGLHVSFP